jgi:hypothetical protein
LRNKECDFLDSTKQEKSEASVSLKLSRNLDLALSFTFQPNISTGKGSSLKQQKFETMGFTYPIKKSF